MEQRPTHQIRRRIVAAFDGDLPGPEMFRVVAAVVVVATAVTLLTVQVAIWFSTTFVGAAQLLGIVSFAAAVVWAFRVLAR